MAGQNYTYPAGSAISLAAEGTNGALAPSQSLLVAGIDNLNDLHPLQIDASGNLKVNINAAAGTLSTNLTQVGGASIALGQALMAASIPVAIASDQSAIPSSQSGTWNINNISGTVSLPTGAATAANQSTIIADLVAISGQLPATLGQKAMAASLSIAIASDQTAVPISAASLPLPTGASTAANQTNGSQKSQIVDGSGNVIGSTSNALNVNISGGSVAPTGLAATNHVRNDYTSVNVTTAAYVQLIASTASTCQQIYIFDSSGQTLVLATGAPASEVDQILITPGGNGLQPLRIAAGTRVSIKAVSATANVGEIDINLFG